MAKEAFPPAFLIISMAFFSMSSSLIPGMAMAIKVFLIRFSFWPPAFMMAIC